MGGKRIKSHTFRGKRFTVAVYNTIQGYTENAAAPSGKREIYVNGALTPRKFLEVAVHEAMHAEDPSEAEGVVGRRAAALARWLWRLGYRRLP